MVTCGRAAGLTLVVVGRGFAVESSEGQGGEARLEGQGGGRAVGRRCGMCSYCSCKVPSSHCVCANNEPWLSNTV